MLREVVEGWLAASPEAFYAVRITQGLLQYRLLQNQYCRFLRQTTSTDASGLAK